jgi:hypothetical protein
MVAIFMGLGPPGLFLRLSGEGREALGHRCQFGVDLGEETGEGDVVVAVGEGGLDAFRHAVSDFLSKACLDIEEEVAERGGQGIGVLQRIVGGLLEGGDGRSRVFAVDSGGDDAQEHAVHQSFQPSLYVGDALGGLGGKGFQLFDYQVGGGVGAVVGSGIGDSAEEVLKASLHGGLPPGLEGGDEVGDFLGDGVEGRLGYGDSAGGRFLAGAGLLLEAGGVLLHWVFS